MGATLHTGDMSMADIVTYAQAAEALGFDGFWLTEESGKEVFAVLAVLAQQTRTIGLGTGIINFYSRTPTLIAMGANTIDHLSRGRMRLGLGSGGIGFMQRGHGIDLEQPLARAREYVTIIRRLLAGERITYEEGRWFRPRSFRLREAPFRQGLEIYLSALNPRMTQLAAEIADGFIANCVTPEYLAELRASIRIGAARSGRDPAGVKILTLTMTCVDPGNADAVLAMKRGLALYCASPHYHHIFELSGFRAEAERLKARWDAGDFDGAARAMSDAMVQAFTVTGSREQCRQRLRLYREAGVYPIIYPVPRHGRVLEDMQAALRLAVEYAGSG
jgi:probable F420-dependent oxidoreductase